MFCLSPPHFWKFAVIPNFELKITLLNTGGTDVIERVNLLLHVCVNVYHEARDKIGSLNMLQAVQYGQAMKHKQVRKLITITYNIYFRSKGTRRTTLHNAVSKTTPGDALYPAEPRLYCPVPVSTVLLTEVNS